ncbi:Flagellar biosynthesis protein flhA,type III secretion system protein,Type III secretory pathway, component EscV,flagellar biosynthesis protein FlhA,FHIPEP family [Chlamydia serpentis]|uniref:Flagellar biosynthesis protein flhA,type III secretion system protein,Type III secretory pathway, component EscV,flagellar biosynthesis protein FlhA,FHIPEP family n=1 Tax=Chlamydia serpentis TaxID=1967782 RepID=A0A2R8FAZ7_9CHLA|nr:FHIPEP family type III secretion protein [Chlamydia serpentis]SPN73502.1 Flagellar biosynthesis protein flhA,type III secretion system protein,Type III secretory pathway, component EscV,flagellar biosynthesis protein FlhA,FHIPEP family [Chlamydia serpentis]
MSRKKSDIRGMIFVPIGILLLIFLPLPQIFLDFGLCINFALSLLTVCSVFSLRSSSSAKLFPSFFLYLCLLRLGLNLASTRWIVSSGTASLMISSLGSFFSLGNIWAATFASLLLFLVNFLVVSKGSERIAEVRSRFILEALPGKQMSLDADLVSGRASYRTIKKKKDELIEESDFFSAMEGVFRFVKGDAVVSFILLIINVISVLILHYTLGYTLNEMWFTVLGDALVSQIPAFLTSCAAATLISKIDKEENLLSHLVKYYKQLRQHFRTVSLLIFSLCFIPSSPKFPIALIASLLWLAYRKEKPCSEDTCIAVALAHVQAVSPKEKESQLYEAYCSASEEVFKELGVKFPKLTHVCIEGAETGLRLFGQNLYFDSVNLETLFPLLRNIAHEALNGEMIQKYLEESERYFGIVVEEIIPKKISLSSLVMLCRLLVKERVSLRLFPKILEAIAIYQHPGDSLEVLAEKVRKSLGPSIGRSLWDQKQTLEVITVDCHVEELINNSYSKSNPEIQEKVIRRVDSLLERSVFGDFRAVVTSCETRCHMKKILNADFPDLLVLSHNELPKEIPVSFLGIVSDDVLIS